MDETVCVCVVCAPLRVWGFVGRELAVRVRLCVCVCVFVCVV